MIRRLGARYELIEPIGGGGMAVVYRAVDTLLDRTVAVKMLRPQYAGDDEFVARFRQEAQSAARLSHPNIVNLYDIGVSDNEYYLVMEYVDGPTLKQVIRQSAPMEIADVIDISMQICDALEHAHNRQIIHRDIKPHNILLTDTGVVKVTDFGIARAITGNTITYQQATSVLGSVHYFSPEQARGATADVKSDIYSLGVVMYEMLTNELPFSGDTPVSVALKHLQETFVEPRDLYPEIPQSLENVVLKCLVKSPEFRYQDMKSVKEDLKDALVNPDVPKYEMPKEDYSDATISMPAIGGNNLPLQTLEEDEAATNIGNPVKKKRKTWVRILLGTLISGGVLVVAAVAAYFIYFDLISTTKDLTMPKVVGLTEAKAKKKLLADEFLAQNIHFKKGYNSNYPSGEVYYQDPSASQTVKQTRDVNLYVSLGAQRISMPDLQGFPLDKAMQELVNRGVPQPNISVTTEYSQSGVFSKGQVIDTNPPAGSLVSVNQKVEIVESLGVQTVVPNVIGLSVTEAKILLKTEGLTVGHVYMVSAPGAVNDTVVGTSPYNPLQSVQPGTVIDLQVADNGSTGGSTGTPATGNQTSTSGAGTGNSTGNSTGNATSNSTGTVTGNSIGNSTGNSTGTVTGNSTATGGTNATGIGNNTTGTQPTSQTTPPSGNSTPGAPGQKGQNGGGPGPKGPSGPGAPPQQVGNNTSNTGSNATSPTAAVPGANTKGPGAPQG